MLGLPNVRGEGVRLSRVRTGTESKTVPFEDPVTPCEEGSTGRERVTVVSFPLSTILVPCSCSCILWFFISSLKTGGPQTLNPYYDSTPSG